MSIEIMRPTREDGYQPILTASVHSGLVALSMIDEGNRIERVLSMQEFQLWASTVLAEISLAEG